MDGPSHYLEAGRLVEAAKERTQDGDGHLAARYLHAASVHATLALAAATAAVIPSETSSGDDNSEIVSAWHEAGAW